MTTDRALLVTALAVAAACGGKAGAGGGAAGPEPLLRAFVAAQQPGGAALRDFYPGEALLAGLCDGDPASVTARFDALAVDAEETRAELTREGYALALGGVRVPETEPDRYTVPAGARWYASWGTTACTLRRPIEIVEVVATLTVTHDGQTITDDGDQSVVRIGDRWFLADPLQSRRSKAREEIADGFDRCRAFLGHVAGLRGGGLVDDEDALAASCVDVRRAEEACALAANTAADVAACMAKPTAGACEVAVENGEAMGYGDSFGYMSADEPLAICLGKSAAVAACQAVAGNSDDYMACAEPAFR